MNFEKRFSFSDGREITVCGENHEIILKAKKNGRETVLRSLDLLEELLFPLAPEKEMPDGKYYASGLRFSTEETADSLTVHTCPTDSHDAPLSRAITHYRFERAGENAVRISAWFGAREPVRVKKASLFKFRADCSGFTACESIGPDFVWPFGTLGHSVRTGAAALTGSKEYILLSHCGTVEYTPGDADSCELAVCTGQAEGIDLRQIDIRHPITCVFSAGDGKPEIPDVSAPVTPEPAAIPGKKHVLRSGRLQMALYERPTGVSLGGIRLDDFSPCEDLSAPLTLVRLCRLSDKQTADITSEQEWERVRVLSGEKSLRVVLENPFGIRLTVTAEARAVPGDAVEWRVRVFGCSEDYTVVSVSYPALAFGGGRNGHAFFRPKNSGMLDEHAFSREVNWSAPYPAGYRCSVPVMGVYDPERKTGSGLYAAVHMNAAERVDLSAAFFRCGEGCFFFDYPAKGLGLEGNSFELAGRMVVRVLDGDWYDMAKIYQAWVTEHAEWCPPKGREDSPAWMRETPLYVMDWMPNDNPDADPVPISIRPPTEPPRDNWIKKPAELADRLGMPIGYHLYNWHFNPFNNDFPYYFPVKEGLEEGVLYLNAHNVRVMPYINGRIADTRDTRGENIRFDRYLRSGATKNPNGGLNIETYASHEPDGELCRLAAMCPTTPYWRNILAETVRRLFKEYHMSAVYIDQVGAAQSNLCCDRSHQHQPGNGEWWVRGYRLLMEKLRAEMPEGCGFTTESGAECYADQFDGFLTWQWVEPNLVPFLPKVYNGRIAMLGRNTNGYKKKDGLYCRYHLGQALMFGQQMGWINPDVVDEEEKIDYLERLCRARWDLKDVFIRGEMLRPPMVVSGGSRFLTDSNMRRVEFGYADTLLASAWQCDGRILLLITNCADEETEAKISFDMEECGDPAGAEEKAYGDCRLIRIGNGEAEAHMGGRSCLVLSWK